MKKWNKILVIASAVTVMGIFTGCKSSGGTQTPAAPETTAAAQTTAAAETETTAGGTAADDAIAKLPESADDRELVSAGEGYGNPIVDVKKMVEDFGSLIDQPDEKAVALLGEGTVPSQEESVTFSRQYQMELFGGSVVTDVFYAEEKVSGFQLALEGTDMAGYVKQLTEALGKPESEKNSTNDGSAIQSAVWRISGTEVELLKAYDTITIQLYKTQ